MSVTQTISDLESKMFMLFDIESPEHRELRLYRRHTGKFVYHTQGIRLSSHREIRLPSTFISRKLLRN